ncbi:ethanolamine-phosphate cytidylyltransferase, putative [Babesia ovis]|uniref:Ethanolamine-phosphate cytidylyltransferase, putative n=1 Tax=Babesia ovis TaxID=5869 RepID=A0A9W5TBW6_BABOV|nr:ethanolamine-phosphate cytidylyltransferase, putative [Babesia ovis]
MAVETRGRNGMRRLVKLLLGTAAITSFMNVNVSAAAVKEGVESVDPQDGVVKTVASEGDEPQKKSLRASGDKQQEDKESLEKYGDRMYDVLYNLSRSDLPQTVIPRHHFHDGEDLKAEARKKYCDCKKTHCSCSQPILIITEEEITSDEPDECDELPQAQLPTVDKSEENKPRGTVSLADPLYDLEHNKDWGSIIDFDSLYERGRDIKKRITRFVLKNVRDKRCRKMARLLEGDRLLKIPIDLAQKLSVVESDKLPDELIEDLADCIADDLTTEICGPKPVSPISLLPTKESKWLDIRWMMKDYIIDALIW